MAVYSNANNIVFRDIVKLELKLLSSCPLMENLPLFEC